MMGGLTHGLSLLAGIGDRVHGNVVVEVFTLAFLLEREGILRTWAVRDQALRLKW
jgi:hypothetical protein